MKKFCIIIPFHNPWTWHTDYTNQTAVRLSKHYTVICYLWGDAVSIREIITGKKPYIPITKNGRLWLYHPLFIIPGKRIISIQYVNMFFNCIAVYIVSLCISIFQKRTLIFWFFGIFDPVFLLLPLFFRHTQTVYDCVDIPSHPNVIIDSRLKKSEKHLLSYAWIVTANSKTMLSRLTPVRTDTHLVPLGFRNEAYRTPKPYIIPKRKRRVVGYIGAIDYRINRPLLEYLVTHHRDWQFALMGPVFTDHLSTQQYTRLLSLLAEPNVHHACISHTHIPSLLSQCDVTIIPYAYENSFNRFSFPMKTMEYLYSQKRIISSPIHELIAYDRLVRFAHTKDDWERAIAFALHHPLKPAEKRRAKAIAASHTWNKKIESLVTILETTRRPD